VDDRGRHHARDEPLRRPLKLDRRLNDGLIAHRQFVADAWSTWHERIQDYIVVSIVTQVLAV
jgi:hypothetical protein